MQQPVGIPTESRNPAKVPAQCKGRVHAKPSLWRTHAVALQRERTTAGLAMRLLELRHACIFETSVRQAASLRAPPASTRSRLLARLPCWRLTRRTHFVPEGRALDGALCVVQKRCRVCASGEDADKVRPVEYSEYLLPYVPHSGCL